MAKAILNFQPRKIHIYAKKMLDAFLRNDHKTMIKYAELWAESKAFLELEKNDFLPFADE